MIVAGVEALKGEIEDASRVAKEIKKVSSQVETPSGTLAFDQYNQRIVNGYVVKAEKKEGKLGNVVIDRVGRVTQEATWKWWHK